MARSPNCGGVRCLPTRKRASPMKSSISSNLSVTCEPKESHPMAAATATKPKQSKTTRLKQKAEQRKKLDEIKSLALRQGYVTEDQVVWMLDDSEDPESQVEPRGDIHRMLNQRRIEGFATEEDAQA